MLLDRRSALAGVLLTLALAGCGASSNSGSAQQLSSPAATTAPTSPSASHSAPAGASTASSSPSTVASTPATVAPTLTRPAASAINLGPSLCSGADVAQNAADAYMGALSAGDAQQATACVLPRTVPAALTRSLLAHASTTAAYLPRDGVNGPSVFGYRGNGKSIDVTVTKQPNGDFWVTEVAVGNG